MKKVLALIITAAMSVTALCACAGTTSDTTSAETTAAETQAAAFDPSITADRQNLFDAGMEGFVGVNYTPVLFLGVPADDPLGNTFLCTASVVSPDATPYWALVTMEDVGSEVTITDIKIIDYAAASTDSEVTFTEDDGGAALGAFEVATDVEIPAEIQGIDGHDICEILATQVVSGMNYSCLCLEGEQWEIVTVYVNTQGEAEVTNVAALNF